MDGGCCTDVMATVRTVQTIVVGGAGETGRRRENGSGNGEVVAGGEGFCDRVFHWLIFINDG